MGACQLSVTSAAVAVGGECDQTDAAKTCKEGTCDDDKKCAAATVEKKKSGEKCAAGSDCGANLACVKEACAAGTVETGKDCDTKQTDAAKTCKEGTCGSDNKCAAAPAEGSGVGGLVPGLLSAAVCSRLVIG